MLLPIVALNDPFSFAVTAVLAATSTTSVQSSSSQPLGTP